jgi:hypothetical protein
MAPRDNSTPVVRADWRAVLAACLVAILPSLADAQVGEYEVKAAFLLNFTKFVDWPASAFAEPGVPFAICVLGKDPFGRSLDEVVQGESVAGRRLVVRRISDPPGPQACQLLFVDASIKELSRVLSGVPPGVLTVGDGERFVHDGGMIGFVIENRRVRFDIHQSAAERAALKLSSKLLSVARTVEK